MISGIGRRRRRSWRRTNNLKIVPGRIRYTSRTSSWRSSSRDPVQINFIEISSRRGYYYVHVLPADGGRVESFNRSGALKRVTANQSNWMPVENVCSNSSLNIRDSNVSARMRREVRQYNIITNRYRVHNVICTLNVCLYYKMYFVNTPLGVVS